MLRYAEGQSADIRDNVTSYHLLPEAKSLLRQCEAEQDVHF